MSSSIDPKLTHPHESELLEPDLVSMLAEFDQGKPVGEAAHIEGLSDQFTWKKTFVNCWTGRPNEGKSTLLMFLALLKSKRDNWKWCLWSPEMINSHKADGKITRSSSDIFDELIHAFSGKNPYKHFTQKYGIPQMKKDEYIEALEWLQDRIFVINPEDKKYNSLLDCFKYWNDVHSFDGFIIDPFKNVRYDQKGTTDVVLHHIFDEIKDVAIDTNTSINIVAHPKSVSSGKDARKDGKENGAYRVVTQFDLLGGSAWDNAMDGIFSVYRPFRHKDPNDPRTWLYHLKQRKKHLVGETGVYKRIQYNMQKNRFFFDGVCPLSGDFERPLPINEFKPKVEETRNSPNQGKGEIKFETAEEMFPGIDKQDEPAF